RAATRPAVLSHRQNTRAPAGPGCPGQPARPAAGLTATGTGTCRPGQGLRVSRPCLPRRILPARPGFLRPPTGGPAGRLGTPLADPPGGARDRPDPWHLPLLPQPGTVPLDRYRGR